MNIFLNEKKIVRLIACFITLSACILFSSQGYAAPANSSQAGYVDYQFLIDNHPDTAKANEALKAQMEQAKKEFDEKAANMSDQDKQLLNQQLSQQIEQKRQELLKPIVESVNAAIKEVADAKGLSIVVYKDVVIYGSVDITNEVGKKLTK